MTALQKLENVLYTIARRNGHSAAESKKLAYSGAREKAQPTASPATKAERAHGVTVLSPTLTGVGESPAEKAESEAADQEAGSGSLVGKLTKATNPAREGSEETIPTVEKGAEAVGEAPNDILQALNSFISGYGVRALEVIGGALLLLFGLYTIAKKGDVSPPPVVPIPV